MTADADKANAALLNHATREALAGTEDRRDL